MTQTTALLIDGYRQVNDKKLFWITLGLSGLVVAIIAMLGVTPEGLKILIWELKNPVFNATVMPPAEFYKYVFTTLGISIWLAWIASILALVSTGSIFPDFLAQGSVDLVLSRPIGRVKLFFVKYLSGLLFAALQVTVFTVGSFLVIGVRGGVWEPGLFIAIPVFVLFFSYLFSICVFLGVLSRSSMLAILVTILLWFCLFIVNSTDGMVSMIKAQMEVKVERLERELAEAQAESIVTVEAEPDAEAPVEGESEPETQPEEEAESAADIEHLADRIEDARGEVRTIQRVADTIIGIKTVMPKTGETIGLLERWLIDTAHLPRQRVDGNASRWQLDQRAAEDKLIENLRGRSVSWIIGTSVIFECVLLLLACWRFSRRDF